MTSSKISNNSKKSHKSRKDSNSSNVVKDQFSPQS